MRLFVYGTLRNGEYANDLLLGDNTKMVADTACVFDYGLFDAGSPAAVRKQYAFVCGEVWDVDDRRMPQINRYEGGGYKQVPVVAKDNEDKLYNCMMYMYKYDTFLHPRSFIPDGDWVKYRKNVR